MPRYAENWAAELKNVQAGVFSLLALLVYLRFALGPRSAALYALAFGGFVLAVLSKTVACTVPAAALVCVWWKRGSLARRDIVPVLPLFLVGLAGGLGTALVATTSPTSTRIAETSRVRSSTTRRRSRCSPTWGRRART